MAYAALPDLSDADGEIWRAIIYWGHAKRGEDALRKASELERVLSDQMRAFADATCALRASHGQAPATQQAGAEPPGIQALMCVISSLRDMAHFSDEEGGELMSALCALRDWAHAQPAPATQQAGEVRRAELVPGVMHCAKCKFQLNRVTLCVSDGNAYAGNNKTEPCPNGCGPLWPVTWEQEAKNCWKALEEMHERLMAAAAPQPSTTAQAAEPFCWHWENTFNGGTGTVKKNPETLGINIVHPDHKWTALYTAPQPVAREQLTRERVKEIVRGAGYDQCGIPDTERAAFINGLRHGEQAHGIKGGQHGTE